MVYDFADFTCTKTEKSIILSKREEIVISRHSLFSSNRFISHAIASLVVIGLYLHSIFIMSLYRLGTL